MKSITAKLISVLGFVVFAAEMAALAVPSQALAQPITFPNPTVQIPWATGRISFGHIQSKTGPLDVLASAPGQSYFPYAQVWKNDGSGNFTAGA